MPKINFEYTKTKADESKYGKGYGFLSLPKKEFDSFNPAILGLGDISQEGEYIQALAAIYDLEGFTEFCNQVDSHLVIPEFLKRFLDWLFISLAAEFKENESDDEVTVWGRLPFYTKFLGDGILFIWDTGHMKHLSNICNVIKNLLIVSKNYRTKFLPEIKKHVSKPPAKLRCGVARGQIISIGDGDDYVGSCINIAARLQKLSQLSVAISRRGLDLSQVPPNNQYWKQFILKKVELRGIGTEELVYVDLKEWQHLPLNERKLFKKP